MATQKSSTTKKVIIGGVIVYVGLGIVALSIFGYIGYRLFKKSKELEKNHSSDFKKNIDDLRANSSNQSTSSPSTELDFKTTLSFRKWMHKVHPEYSKAIGLSLNGTPDAYAYKQAFNEYGQDFIKKYNIKTK